MTKDNWNLVEHKAIESDIPIENDLYHKDQIKIFIKLINEKQYVFERGASFMDGVKAVLEEIDKRAGNLK